MVGWFDPGPLVTTAMDVLVSTMSAGARTIGCSRRWRARTSPNFFDYAGDGGRREQQDISIDYLADTSDGWNFDLFGGDLDDRVPPSLPQTSRDAHSSTRGTPPHLRWRSGLSDGEPPRLRPSAGEPLRDRAPIFALARAPNCSRSPAITTGTTASCRSRACSAASAGFEGCAPVSGAAISRCACLTPGGSLAQTCRLGLDIDALQVGYFKRVAAAMRKGDRIIMCSAEPRWVLSEASATSTRTSNKNNLHYLAHVFARAGAGRWCTSPAICTITGATPTRTHAEDHRRRRWRVPASDARARRVRAVGRVPLRKAFPQPSVSRRLA